MTEESHNPFFRTKRFTPADHKDGIMTANGAAEKSFLLLAIITIVASIVWWGAASGVIAPTVVWILVIVGVIASIIIAITLAFKPQWSPALAPTYAILEGGVLGAISMVFENMYPGIVIQAIALTLGIALTMLALYRSGIIKVTKGFWIGVMIATAGVMIVSLIAWVLSLFGVSALANSLFGNGPWGIVFSLVVIVIATLNLCLDFEFIVQASKNKFPKYYEWYAAFGLAVTLVWLYLEILRLLVKLRSND